MQRKVALPCGVCRGKGFYICKLCKGNATIEWSPMYDPVAINPCLCPTCEGNRLLSDFILFFFNLLELYFKCLVYNFSFVLCLVAEKTISSLLFYKLNCRKNALSRFG